MAFAIEEPGFCICTKQKWRWPPGLGLRLRSKKSWSKTAHVQMRYARIVVRLGTNMEASALVERNGVLLCRELQLLILPGRFHDQVPEQGLTNTSTTTFRQYGHSPYVAGFVQRREHPGDASWRIVGQHRKKMIGNFVGIVPLKLRRYLLLFNKNLLADAPDVRRSELPAVFANSDGHGITRNTQNPDYKDLLAGRAGPGLRQTAPAHSYRCVSPHIVTVPVVEHRP